MICPPSPKIDSMVDSIERLAGKILTSFRSTPNRQASPKARLRSRDRTPVKERSRLDPLPPVGPVASDRSHPQTEEK